MHNMLTFFMQNTKVKNGPYTSMLVVVTALTELYMIYSTSTKSTITYNIKMEVNLNMLH